MNDIIAMICVEFDAKVDRISREMFAARLQSPEFNFAPQIANCWTKIFEPRSRRTMKQTVQRLLDDACKAARITREQIKAFASFSEEEPGVI
jgi:hypothetical protein